MLNWVQRLLTTGLFSLLATIYIVQPTGGLNGNAVLSQPAATRKPTATRVRPTPTVLATATANDSRIAAIRKIYQDIRTGMQNGSLRTAVREFDYCQPGADTKRVLVTNARGLARMYGRETGSEDSSLSFEHYYDDAGRLRFVFIKGGAVNGSVLEHRIYFDERLRRIREQQTYIKGPGYTWPKVWPQNQLQVSDPARAFRAPNPCE